MNRSDSPDATNWDYLRRQYVDWLPQYPQYAIQIQTIELAARSDKAGWLHAWLSHLDLVITNRPEATHYFDKMIVRITPSGGEACLIRDDKILRNVELDSTNIDHEVTNLLSLIRLPNECKA